MELTECVEFVFLKKPDLQHTSYGKKAVSIVTHMEEDLQSAICLKKNRVI